MDEQLKELLPKLNNGLYWRVGWGLQGDKSVAVVSLESPLTDKFMDRRLVPVKSDCSAKPLRVAIAEAAWDIFYSLDLEKLTHLMGEYHFAE